MSDAARQQGPSSANSGLSIADIKAMLAARAPELAQYLAPRGSRQNYYWMAANPTRDDRKPGSFVVWIAGKGAGAWQDYATGDKGDVIDLIAYCACNGVPPFSREVRVEAIQWAKKWLGVGGARPADLAQRVAVARRAQSEAELRETQKRLQKINWATALWQESYDLPGSLAQTYLASRNIDVDAIAHFSGDLRFLPRMRHPMAGSFYPAMIAAFRAADGALTGVHLTFLADDGKGKAVFAGEHNSKIMIGAIKGSVLRLTHGDSGLAPEKFQQRAATGERLLPGLCAVTEGIEDAASVVMARPDLRVWAAGSLANIGYAPGMRCVSAFLVCADNDWEKPQAMAMLETSLARLRMSGRPAEIARSLIGKDFNDDLQHGRRA